MRPSRWGSLSLLPLATVFSIGLADAILLILASVPFLAFDWPPRTGLYGFPYNVWPLAG